MRERYYKKHRHSTYFDNKCCRYFALPEETPERTVTRIRSYTKMIACEFTLETDLTLPEAAPFSG